MSSSLRDAVDRHRVPAFLLLVVTWSWAVDAVYLATGWWETLPVYVNSFPRQWGLPISAVIVVLASDVPLRAWLDRTLQWRFHPAVYLGAIALPLAVSNVQPVLAGIVGGSVGYAPPAALHLLAAFFVLNLVLFGGVEEVGWRGFLQPALQERFSVLTTGLIVGAVWWAWHLPLFFGHPNFEPDSSFLATYTTFVLGAALVLGALVNHTDGGVLPAVLMHAAINVGAVLAGSGGALDGLVPIGFLVGSGAWWLLAGLLVWRYGPSMVPGDTVASLDPAGARRPDSRSHVRDGAG